MNTKRPIDVQGHRGCRGLEPENTIPAFIKAVELGVTTLEMDLVVTRDKQIIVSHEPFFNHEITTHPELVDINADNQQDFNLFLMDCDEIQTYDVGIQDHPRFPQQEENPAYKPLLTEVVEEVNNKCKDLKVSTPYYNVEIKRLPSQDNKYHPDVVLYAAYVVNTLIASGIKDKTFIQSFDIESLEEVRRTNPEIPLVLLVNNNDSAEVNVSKLSFNPEVYSPEFKLVNKELVDYCRNHNIKLIPWTVNKPEDIKSLLALGVDGIITDYPNLLISIINESNEYEILR